MSESLPGGTKVLTHDELDSRVRSLHSVGAVVRMTGQFDGSRDGRTCPVEYRAEIVPLHRFDLPNAPVTAWKVRILGFGRHKIGDFTEWYGQRHAVRADAVAELESLRKEERPWL